MVKVVGLDKVLGAFKDLQKQIRYATYLATLYTANDTQDDLIKHTASTFTITTGWLRRGGYGVNRRVTPYKVAKAGGEVKASVFVHEGTWWMKEHEGGGFRDTSVVNTKKRGKRIAGFTIPLYAGRGTGRKQLNVPQEKTYSVWQANRKLIFERLSKGASRLIAVMLPKIKINPIWGATNRGTRAVENRYREHYDRELAKAIKYSFF